MKENKKITKLTTIRELKKRTILLKHNKAFNVKKSIGKTKKQTLLFKNKQIDDKLDENIKQKTKKRNILND
jgi:hypothetical protein